MISGRPSRWGLWDGWADAGTGVRARFAAVGTVGLAAIFLQIVSLSSPAVRGWATNLAWALAGVAACAGSVLGGLRVRAQRITREAWLLWGTGSACWTIGVMAAALLSTEPENPAVGVWFLAFPLMSIVSYFRRVPRAMLYVLFLLDAVPVVLLVLALTVVPRHPSDHLVFASLFTGLYVLMAANAIQMLGMHQNVSNFPRTWMFSLAFCVMGAASLLGGPHVDGSEGGAAMLSGAVWTLGLLLLAVAAMSRMLQPYGFVTLLPTEKQTGPHAIAPTAAVFGLILLLVITPYPSALLRGFLLGAALLLVIRVYLVYRQAVRLIAEVISSRERLRMLAEVTSRLKSLVLDELLHTFCGSAREVLGAQYALFGLAGEESAGGFGLTHVVTSCADARSVGADLPHGGAARPAWGGADPSGSSRDPPVAAAGSGGSSAARQRNPAAETLPWPGRAVRLTRPTRNPVSAGFEPGYPPAEGFLGVPVTVGNSTHGALYLAGKQGGFSEEDENLANLLAASGGYAIMNAGLYAESTAQQKQLAAQNERLRELDKLKDEFIALVSHELRSPLTSIIGYVELLREADFGPPDAAYQQFAEMIERNAHRLLRLVGDLLFLSRIQTGKMEMDIRSADLGEIAARAVQDAQGKAKDRHIALALSPVRVPPLACDPERMAQVLDNLITNALKFTPDGGRVEVRLHPGDRLPEPTEPTAQAAGGRAPGAGSLETGIGVQGAVLEVADTGMGISAADQERIFENFFRTATATKQSIPGTGLGLSITKAIVEAHNGTITVESEEGSGTTFRIWIPRQPAAGRRGPAPAAGAATGLTGP